MSIEALLWHGDGSDEPVEIDGSERRTLRQDQLLWVDAEAPGEEEIDALEKSLGLSDGAADALRAELGAPDARVLEGAVQIAVLSLPDEHGSQPVGLQILMGKEWIITRHEEPMPLLDSHRERLRDERSVGKLTPVQFMLSLLDWHVDSFFRAAQQLERQVDQLDEAALRRDDDLLQALVRMRRRIAAVRRVIALHDEVFAELGRPDFLPDLDEREAKALDHVAGRLQRASGAVAHVREMLIGTFDVHMTRTAQRTNEIMKILTLASVILLPAVVLAGIMGMNFRIGLFDDPNLFWVVVGFMVLLAVTTIVVARWRSWL